MIDDATDLDGFSKNMRRPDYAMIVGLTIVAVVLTGVAVVNYFANPQNIDFWVFYSEGRALLAGQPLYEDLSALNLNSPALTSWMFAPLALLPYSVALAVWFGLSVTGMLAGLRCISRELEWQPHQAVALGALLLLTHGSFQAWAIGQLTFPLLFYPLTRAWVAYRHGRFMLAGVWLAPAIVAKPPLALVAILLPVPVWAVAGSLSAGASLLSVPITGIAAWMQWFHLSETVTWLSRTFNASLWGVAARIQVGDGAVTVSGLEPSLIAAVLVIGFALAAATVMQTDRDRRFLCAGLTSTLLSPLGWAYYLPLVAGSAAALWTGSRVQIIAYVLLLPPVGMDTGLGTIGGSVFCLATLATWATFTDSSRARTSSLSSCGDASPHGTPSELVR